MFWGKDAILDFYIEKFNIETTFCSRDTEQRCKLFVLQE